MDNIAARPNKWVPKKRECKVIIETPKGSRNKFNFDQDYGLFALGGLLPEGLIFPFDFGFIPSTLGDDGDPLDAMILMDAPAYPGCALDVRIVGVIEAEQVEDGETTVNNRMIGVAIHSYNHEHVATVRDINPAVLDQVSEFFVSYNKSRGKEFKPKGCHGPKRAAELIEHGIKAFARKKAK